MAERAVLGETRGDMVRIVRRGEIIGMAAEAVRGRPHKLTPNMAGAASQLCVHTRKRELRQIVVIEPGRNPAVKAEVTRQAVAGEARRDVVWIFGTPEVVPMTCGAVRAQSFELPDRRAFVTGFAVDGCMRSQKRETVGVILHGLHRHAPAANRVAPLAIASHLPPVNVRMAVGALHPDVGEGKPGVALPAAHRLVHSPQRVPRLIVIEVGIGPYRSPARLGVAVFARDADRAVGIARPVQPVLSRRG